MIKKLLAGITVAAIITVSLPRLSGAYNQRSAIDYIKTSSSGPWSTLALAAAGENIPSLDHLKNISSDTPIAYTAPILAIVAAGQDPESFNSEKYVSRLKTFFEYGQTGDESTLNDDYFALLALVSAGEPASSPYVINLKNHILNEQNPDGGWGFTSASGSDTNMTAAAVLALLATGESTGEQSIQKAANYLKSAQNSDGGFPYDPNSSFDTSSDSSSTAWVIWVINAFDDPMSSWVKNGNTPVGYLESLQNPNGYFGYQSSDETANSFSTITTAYAVIALEGKYLPTLSSGVERKMLFEFRIEGKDQQICSGKSFGPTALDVVKNAAELCGYDYTIDDTSFGPYLTRIGQDTAQGLIGWLYLINDQSPSVGAADYTLVEGDQVLWYYGDFQWQPTRISTNATEIVSGGQVMVTAEYFDGNSWLALPQADIVFGTSSMQTDSAGRALLLPDDGYYRLYAEKDGYIRSNDINLIVGTGASGSSGLISYFDDGEVAGENPPQNPGDTISFVVEPGQIDFGVIIPGSSSEKSFTVENTGGVDINIESQVKGDELYVNFLRIAGVLWSKFSSSLGTGSGQDYSIKLNVPAEYQTSKGDKAGELIIWASKIE